MADNVTVNGVPVATDEVTSRNGATVAAEQVQRVKPGFGPDGTFQDVDPTNPFPVADAGVGVAGNSPPALATNASGLVGWLRKIVDVLTGGLSVTTTNPTDVSALATSAKQDTLKTSTDAITTKLTSDPSTATNQASANTKLDTLHTDNGGPGSSPPSLANGGSGILGYLRNILDALRGTLTVGGTVAVSSVPQPTVTASALANARVTVTTAGTRVALNGSALVVRRVVLMAFLTNTGVVVPGGSSVVAASASRNGVALNAGDTITLYNVDLNAVYIDSTVNGEGVTVTYQT